MVLCILQGAPLLTYTMRSDMNTYYKIKVGDVVKMNMISSPLVVQHCSFHTLIIPRYPQFVRTEDIFGNFYTMSCEYIIDIL